MGFITENLFNFISFRQSTTVETALACFSLSLVVMLYFKYDIEKQVIYKLRWTNIGRKMKIAYDDHMSFFGYPFMIITGVFSFAAIFKPGAAVAIAVVLLDILLFMVCAALLIAAIIFIIEKLYDAYDYITFGYVQRRAAAIVEAAALKETDE